MRSDMVVLLSGEGLDVNASPNGEQVIGVLLVVVGYEKNGEHW